MNVFSKRTNIRCTSIVFVIGIQFFLAGVNADIEKKSEANTNEPGHRINHQDEENNASHKYLHKRQIGPQLPPFLPQDFQSPFITDRPDSNGPIRQFTGQEPSDEEERFFLSGNQQQETTLNPLAFVNPPQTTLSAIEQQLINEQRRFQEEIANRGLHEQQQRSFGVPQPPTTRATTTTTTTTSNPFDPFSFQENPFIGAEPEAQFEQSTENFPLNSVVLPQSHSFTYSRIFRSLNRRSRSIDRQHLSVNLLESTPAPRQTFSNYFVAPRSDLGSIGNFLVAHFTQQLHRNVANLVESTIGPYSTPYSTRTAKSPYSTPPTYHRPSHTEKPFTHPGSNHRPTTPQPWHHPMIHSTESSTTPQQFSYTESRNTEDQPSWNPSPRIPVFSYNSVEPETNLRTEIPKDVHNIQFPTGSIPLAGNANLRPADPVSYAVPPNSIALHHLPSVYPSYVVSSTPSPTDGITRPAKIKNVQILTSSPVPLDQNILVDRPSDETRYQAYRQIFAADHQRLRPIEITSTQHPSVRTSTEDTSSITSLFKAKINEFKSFHPTQAAAVELQQSNFQQPNRFLEQLQLQPNANISPFVGTNSIGGANPTDSTVGSGSNGGKTAIFIRVPPEEPPSTVGYLFDKTISAKTLQKKENHAGPKKNHRSAQVITSSLVYRTPPGKRASVSRQELSQNNQLDPSEAGRPIRWLLDNAAAAAPPSSRPPTTTNRPFVNALLNFIQNRSPQ